MAPSDSETKDSIVKLLDEFPRFTDYEIGAIIVSRLSNDDRELLAIRMVETEVWHERRARQREIEKASQRVERDERTIKRIGGQGEEAIWKKAFKDPSIWYQYETSEKNGGGTGVPTNRRGRDAFRKWCGRDRFADWLKRARPFAVDEDDRRSVEFFESDWWPSGPMAYHAIKLTERTERYIDEMAEEIRLEVTDELLKSEFALGDGRRVTWGAATEQDHLQRVDMLAKNVQANAETAAMHRKAIEMMKDQNVATLSAWGLAHA